MPATEGPDTLTAPGFETTSGLGGDDSLIGSPNQDWLYGNLGSDTLFGGGAADHLFGGTEGDARETDFSPNLLDGGDGNDYVIGGAGADTLEGGTGADVMVGNAGADVIHAGDGDDGIYGDWVDTEVNAGAGNDDIYINGALGERPQLALITGGDGDDFVRLSTLSHRLVFDGGPGRNSIESIGLSSRDGHILVHLDEDVADFALIGRNVQSLTVLNDVATVYGGAAAEQIVVSDQSDWISAGAGNDSITCDSASALPGGSDTVFGGLGDDVIVNRGGQDYLRGDDGNDSISGGTGFDDINGNAGADTAHGNDGEDWVVGGKDNDLLFGDNSFDIVYGNLGDDTVSGDAGVDWVRGGQGDDSVSGGTGDDWLWGDRGDDTISGGSGADIFHSFSGAGIDRVTDFSLAEGDRVQLDPGTSFTIKQVGSDTVIDLGGGDQVVLVGIQASTLAPTSVFVG